ncbi:MAG TPA: helix-turn-helix domain-containing protein [Chthoniobacterales bacterium]|nr:helix-turn-helix domain-containing protein [Chthoniobacterales bacterium]
MRKPTRQTSKQQGITVPSRPLKIGLLGPPEARVLDLAGPWEVFSRVNEVLAEQQPDRKPGYELGLATIGSSRSINCFGELTIKVAGNFRSLGTNVDTLLIGGGRATWELPKNEELLDWLGQVSAKARRVAAIGSGAFILAEAGLLQGKRVTTHWRWIDRLQRSYPSILVDSRPVFVRDGKFYTSAGVSVSIDLSLAMVEEDYGHKVAAEVAKRLVIFVHRPSGQAQVSHALILQGSDHDRFRDLGVWISNHLDNDLTVDTLAKRSAMSVRNFARRFRQSFGVTPAEFVTRVRVEAACRRLEESTLTMEQIATECGFSSAELLRRASHRVLGHSPNRFRHRARDGSI